MRRRLCRRDHSDLHRHENLRIFLLFLQLRLYIFVFDLILGSPTTVHAIGLGSLHSRYQATQTIPKHHGSTHMESFNMEIWCGLPYLCTGAIYDKTNTETSQSDIQSYGIPGVHTPLQDLLQHTSIPWIEEQDICCMWCQLRRWPTNKEKSTGTLDFLKQCSIIWNSNRRRTIARWFFL